ncbi:MAG: hypothetical protein ACK4QW_17810 [Alphaproteobacteria bacterium]
MRAEPLAPLDPAAVGVGREPDRDVAGDLGADLWAGTRRADVARLLQAVPARIEAPTLNRLVRRVLLTAAAPPDGPPAQPDLPVLRVAALATLGDLDGAAALAGSIPERERSDDLTRIAAEIDLLRHRLDSACAGAVAAVTGSTDPYWQKLTSFCRLHAGQRDEAMLIADLLRERGHRDPAFFAITDTLLGFEKARIATLPSIAPLHLAMLREAGLPLPLDAATTAKPALLRAVALSPNAEPAMRLAAAEQAAAANALDPAMLGRLYTEGRGATAPTTRPGVEGLSAETPGERAALFHAARVATDEAERAAALKALFDAAYAAGVLHPIAAIAGPMLSELRPTGRFAFFAEAAVRALVITGDTDRAAAWFALAVREAPGNSRAAQAAAEVWPLLMLADPATAWSDALFRRWWERTLATDAGLAEARGAAFLSLLDAVETPVPQQAWSLLPTPMPARGTAVPALRDLSAAAERRRRGETLLRAAAVMSTNEPVPAAAKLHAVVTALRTAGFADEARAVALDAAIDMKL